MSNLKNASLVLKTSDLFDNSPMTSVLGYYLTTTKLIVGATNGYVPTNIYIPSVSSKATHNSTINTDGYGEIVLATATTATASHLTVSMKSDNYFLKMPTATTTSNTCKIIGTTLTLSTANNNIAVGQYVTSQLVTSILPPNTYILSGSGLDWELSNSVTLNNTNLNFWTAPTIYQYDGVYATGYVEGTTILSPPQSSNVDGLYFITNIDQTVATKNVSVYTSSLVDLYSVLSDATYNKSNGSCNQFRTSMTWNSINLRTLLGDMYNDYELFNLCLNSITTSTPLDDITTYPDNLALRVNISGLPFINQTYDTGSGHNQSSTDLGTFIFENTVTSHQLYYGTSVITFGKNQELCNISISYKRILDDKDPSLDASIPYTDIKKVVSPFPHTVFIFDIIGVTKTDIKNGSRL